MNIEEWINNKLAEIANRLPNAVHEDPASFNSGYNMGYKQALLDIDRLLEEDDVHKNL